MAMKYTHHSTPAKDKIDAAIYVLRLVVMSVFRAIMVKRDKSCSEMNPDACPAPRQNANMF